MRDIRMGDRDTQGLPRLWNAARFKINRVCQAGAKESTLTGCPSAPQGCFGAAHKQLPRTKGSQGNTALLLYIATIPRHTRDTTRHTFCEQPAKNTLELQSSYAWQHQLVQLPLNLLLNIE